MSAIVFSYDGWLGFGAKYVVRVDGREVGRLGRRTKTVRATVEAGRHTAVVEFAGNRTPPAQVDVATSDEVRLTLNFGSTSALIAGQMIKPWRKRIHEPIGQVPAAFMTLSRAD